MTSEETSGELSDFAKFHEDTFKHVYSLALAKNGRDVHNAYDAAQDAYVVVYKRWDSLTATTTDDALRYVFKVLGNQRVSRIRRRMVEQRALTLLRGGLSEEALLSVEQMVLADETLRAVIALPRRQAEAFLLRWVYGYSNVEIADILGITPSAVGTHLQRAQHTLKLQLGESTTPDAVKGGQA